MINAKFINHSKEDQILSFEITGHAGYAEAGEDIVCAAVSVLAIETVNSIDKMVSHQMTVKEADDEGGYLFAQVKPNLSAEQAQVTQILLKHLYFSLEDVANTYPNYVKIETI
ncbi:ribosomal-processing cysteine protease Prp [Jeotgalibaca porci]|uniref:Ribosomal processing cysteine protease Prp n=1 Tax=Jeotgalibaca porci TaxID=1868793 RepID=A0A6G7WFJ5_9LACT|nr:ribosomal-processing cysteine protease Prp [Jeotgalibaca porci]NLB98947.1 ribosomal-processing cysteine protease Prp [Lactobacillales bacterium]QIK51030.1 ribosomal-processing cysteine protease Prp [Jeotgalibaca porci]